MINFLCKEGRVQQAEELMKLMVDRGPVPDCSTYSILITRVRKTCSADEILSLHDYMVLKGVILDGCTYESILKPLVQENSSTICVPKKTCLAR